MTLTLERFAAAGFGLCIGITAAMAQAAGPTLLGTHDAWETYKTTDGRGVVCYAVTQPQTKEPATARRDTVYFLLTTWPKQKINNEPSVVIGYPFKQGSTATVQVGSDKFEFFTKGDGAWHQGGADEQRLVAAMRAGSEMTVKGMSQRGTLTADTYSLKGLGVALDKIAEGCK